ncbi:alpha/beta-type small acid-soluble spore protein [Novibacillus thermophilus]|jgi:small acid-soluble spore protein D (minor alpha/beta-type SASP)|uniref:Alpha/beta hydrolase n=1 Tax=Novibacillus thermophilus TaxID=1471761 RepID=A0A1U9K545_9BACL|nr:alpha/beta-type small acid-soluble spore protein [Novibacillus thermophilus]AQS55130.1 alpha/beta hydrolase [Novibacillus thermophilus]
MASRRRLLVPESREALDKLKAQVISRQIGRSISAERAKFEAAKHVGVPLSKGYNGDLKTKSAGKIGGVIGGQMVKELVRMAQESLINEKKRPH